MAITTLHSLFAVELVGGPSTWLGGIMTDSMPMASETVGEGTSGSLWPHIVSLASQAPTRSWATKDLASHFIALGGLGDHIGHTLVAANPRLRLWQYKHQPGGSRAAGNSHKSILISQGMVVVGGLTVEHQGDAILTYTAIPVSANGLASPLTIAESATLPEVFPVTDDKRWTLGPVYIAGTRFDHLRGVDISFGVTAVAEGADSDIWPTFVSIRSVNPVITLRGIDVGWFSDASSRIPALGKAFIAANTWIFLRKRLQGGSYVQDATAEPIRLEATGIAIMDVVHDANENVPAELTLRMTLRGTASAAPLKITSTPGGVAITVP